MKISRFEEFEVSGTYKRVVTFNDNDEGDTVTSEIYIEVEDPIVCEAVGFVSLDSPGVPMSMVRMDTFSTVSKIEDSGIYMVLVGSLARLELNFTGDSKVSIKSVL